MQGPDIKFNKVSLHLGNSEILRDISFDIQAGTIHCIIGANGGGKTSLIRCLLGQMPHTGEIAISWKDNRVVGYVPQMLEFDRTLPVTVMDFMTMTTQKRPAFLGTSKAHRKEIEEVLDRVGLKGKRKSKFGSLSGGERQRVLFAQAFLPEPALLVLDEPMTGLDLAGGEILESLVKTYAQSGGTVVWINHDIAQVNEVADRLTYINRTVMLDGKPNEVLRTGAATHLFPTLQLAQAHSVGAH